MAPAAVVFDLHDTLVFRQSREPMYNFLAEATGTSPPEAEAHLRQLKVPITTGEFPAVADLLQAMGVTGDLPGLAARFIKLE